MRGEDGASMGLLYDGALCENIVLFVGNFCKNVILT